MSTSRKLDLISVEDYLKGEIQSLIKHEFVGGRVYPLIDFTDRHNLIAGGIVGALAGKLRGFGRRVCNSQTKIRLRLPTEYRFYYPDCSVLCRQNRQDDCFQDDPAITFEVISRSTRRTDEGEKKDAYFTIPSLSVYALVEQESVHVVAYRRTETGFVSEVFEGTSAVIPLPEIDTELPLAEIYKDVQFAPKRIDEREIPR